MVALLVILTFIGFIVADGLVQWVQARREEEALGGRSAALAARPLMATGLPSGLYLSPGHAWLELDRSGAARMGIDALIAKALGGVDSIELPEPGKELAENDELFAIRRGSRRLSVRAPLEGTVSSVNPILKETPGECRNSPYDSGWVCEFKPKNLSEGLSSLRIGERAGKWLEQELGRLTDFLMAHREALPAGQVLQDGGMVPEGVLDTIDDDTWEEFGGQFLSGKRS